MKKKAASLFCVNHQIKIIIRISVDQYQYFSLFLLKNLNSGAVTRMYPITCNVRALYHCFTVCLCLYASVRFCKCQPARECK